MTSDQSALDRGGNSSRFFVSEENDFFSETFVRDGLQARTASVAVFQKASAYFS